VMFGVLDDEHESFYSEKISHLEADLIKLSNERTSVVKSTLKSVNYTLQSAAANQAILGKAFMNPEYIKTSYLPALHHSGYLHLLHLGPATTVV
jgi:hypothetical protein